MGKLTTHVLNIVSGKPAAGMRAELRGPADSAAAVAAASAVTTQTDMNGRCAAPLLQGDAFQAGRYSLTFHVAAYFRSQGQALADPPFLDEVTIGFGIADPQQDYHVPLLVTPWSYSTYRGS